MAATRPQPHPAGHQRRPTRRPTRRELVKEQLPVGHRLSRVYRFGAGLVGVILVVFGLIGLINQIGFFDTGGAQVGGLNTNGTLSVLSIVVGGLLFYGMVRGGNLASSLNIVLGSLFVLSGFVNLALLATSYNFLAFRLQNVVFSFAVGVLLLLFGMYGRVGGSLPHDNPYWQRRHPEQAERDRHELAVRRGDELRRRASLFGS